MFELAENIARATSIPDAVRIWSSPLNEGLILLVNDKSVKKVGCAIPDCLVCAVSPVFICRSDLRTLLHRTSNWLCACMAVSDVDGR